MTIIQKLKSKLNIQRVLKNRKKFYSWLPDSIYLRILYYAHTGDKLNLNNPCTFNEKLQWLKLNDRKKIHTSMVDKYAVKGIVSDKIGSQYIIPTIGVWDSFDDIPLDTLPDKFVIKTTHGGGGNDVEIVHDKQKWDSLKTRKRFTEALKKSIWRNYREWPYKDVPRKIIIEKLIEDESGDLMDYKIFCFNGEPKFLKVDFNRFTHHQANYYDHNWDLLPFGEVLCPPNPMHLIEKPKNLEEMFELARILASGNKFLRVDFYNINGRIYFGEMTFYPASGMGNFTPKEWDLKLGDFLNLTD